MRNTLLTAISKEPVSYSQLIDGALNPFPAFKELRSLINREELAELMDQIGDLSLKDMADRKNGPLVNKALAFMYQLAPLYTELSTALPSAERQTQLDIVCETSYGLVTVEMQVSPQNYWDGATVRRCCELLRERPSMLLDEPKELNKERSVNVTKRVYARGKRIARSASS